MATPITLRELDGDRRRPSCKGVGERKRDALASARHRDRARPAHHLPAPLGRPHQRGPRRRPRGRAGGAGAGRPCARRTSGRLRNRRTIVEAVGRRRHRADARRVLQPAVARAPAARRAAGRAVRQGRDVPRRAADDEPGRRPDRRPHRSHRADLPAEREGAAARRGSSPAGSRTRSSAAGRAASPTRCRTAIRRRLGLVDRGDALRSIHLPETIAEKEQARRRLAFDELLRVQLVLVLRKRALERDAVGHRATRSTASWCGASTPRCRSRSPAPSSGRSPRSTPTSPARTRCTGCCRATSAPARRSSPSRRCSTAVQGGHQGALMAPTEVLAEQHAASVRRAARRPRPCPTPTTCSATGRCASSCSPTASPAPSAASVLAGLADGARRHRHRHPRADPGGRRVPQPRRGRDRRAAPLRRRAAGGAARQGRRRRCPTCW